MTAGTYNIELEQGATWDKTFSLYTDSARTTPKDISGYTAKMHLRLTKTDPETIIELSTGGSGITIGGSSSNEINVIITAAQTTAFCFVKSFYDLEITTGSTTTRLLEGEVSFSKEVTR